MFLNKIFEIRHSIRFILDYLPGLGNVGLQCLASAPVATPRGGGEDRCRRSSRAEAVVAVGAAAASEGRRAERGGGAHGVGRGLPLQVVETV